jgi:two-component system chemotaxis response regulator CheB
MAKEQTINVLIVEQSSALGTLLAQILSSDPQIQVIGTAKSGADALEFLTQKSPDVVLMDIEMPEMDGFETTRRIMETRPVPIIICSGSNNPREAITTFRSMEAGAVACVEKPLGNENADFDIMAAHLLQTIKLMSEVKVVRRWSRARYGTAGASAGTSSSPKQGQDKIEVIGIGASTGGPPVLQTILTGLPKDFPVPLLIVQHIAPGFLPGLVQWLDQTTGFKVHVASYGVEPLPGHVYLAPDDFHMTVRTGGRIALSKEEAENSLRPSVDYLFRSLADVCGVNAVGVLLTGMGKDGANELRRMKDRGAITIVQDRETSIVHGMPGEAIALGAATYVLSADKIAPSLIALVRQRTLATGQGL